MTVSALPFEEVRPRARRGLPELLADRPIEPRSALGRLFAPADDAVRELAMARALAEAPRRLLGELADAVELLPPFERARVAVLAAWVEALFDTAHEADPLERRLAHLHRSAFLIARALAGEPSESPFVRAFVAESARRSFTRPALDSLLAAARERAETPRPATRPEAAARAFDLGAALVTALVGAPASPAAVEAATALVRLLALRRLPAALGAGRVALPVEDLPEPLQYRSLEEVAAAAAAECEAIRPILLRGARALGEVPLTFRRPLAYLLSTALDLLGQIEVQPEALARREPRLGWWARRITLWRIRRQPIA